MSFRCRVSAAWTGWIDTQGSRRSLVALANCPPGVDARNDEITPEMFPGRWNPVHAFPEALEPLTTAAGNALAWAGWWRKGSGESCAGGLVVGADGGFVSPSLAFARQIAGAYSPSVSPSDFIHALPSTAASLLSMLYGLGDYQATLLQGPSSGVMALGHALDLMAVERLERALVATLSVSASCEEQAPALARVAVAFCVEPTTRDTGLDVELEVGRTSHARGTTEAARQEADGLSERLEPFGALAALPLVKLAIELERAQRRDGQIRSTSGEIKIGQPADEQGEGVFVSARLL